VTVDEIIDRLYSLPVDAFTRERNDEAAQLRKDGRRVEAERVKALRKPTAAAAAANLLVREHRAEVEDFIAAAAELRDAQFKGKGDVGSAAARERVALERLVRSGGDGVRQTLLAAAVDDSAAGELLAGRLERELEPRGFGTLEAAPSRRQPPRAKPAGRKSDDRAARARLREAKGALGEAEAEERQAERNLAQARRKVERAQDAVAKAEHGLERLRTG
jgi:hypothetical protein